MEYRELRAALEVFDFDERISLDQVKERYREMVRLYHPDRGGDADPEKIRQVNAAYRVLRAYCRDYSFNCSREEFLEQYPEERLREQFGAEWGEDV